MDEDKIIREGKYDLDDVRKAIDEQYINRGLRKTGDGFYQQTTKDDFCELMSATFRLIKQDWFRKYVTECKWYNSDDKNNPEDYDIEDFIEYSIKEDGYSFDAAM